MILTTVEAAVNYLQQGGEKPEPKEVVAALLAAEKLSKREQRQYHYEDLVGIWRLGFVSRTQTVRSGPSSRPVKQPGKGRFLPKLVKVEIAYSKRDLLDSTELPDSTEFEPNVRLNNVNNRVTIGPLQLCLSGPTRFWPTPNALAFDFTNVAVDLGSWTAYQGKIRGGENSSQAFGSKSLKDQAFFTFFLIEADHIAARGKGGGLALWTRSDER